MALSRLRPAGSRRWILGANPEPIRLAAAPTVNPQRDDSWPEIIADADLPMAYSLSVESITVRNSNSRLAVTRSAEAPRPFARLPTVMLATGLGRSTIYRLVASGAFPAPVHLGPGAVAWRWSDLDRWSESRGADSH